MAIQISAAMKFFEQSGFIHRDLVSKYCIPGNFRDAKFLRNNFLQSKFLQMDNEACVASSCGWNFAKFNFAREQKL